MAMVVAMIEEVYKGDMEGPLGTKYLHVYDACGLV
jgi:hypothetical protein